MVVEDMLTQLSNRQFIQDMILVSTEAEVVYEADAPEEVVTSVVVQVTKAAIVESVVNMVVELLVSAVAVSLDSSVAAGLHASGANVINSPPPPPPRYCVSC